MLYYRAAMSTPDPPAAVGKADGPLPADVVHIEGAGGNDDEIVAAKAFNFVTDNSHEVSKYANWTFFQTLKNFWRAMAISFACGVCALGDGYQYKMPGNIVALGGFIKQMGTQNPKTGAYALDSQHVAAWGGKFSILVLVLYRRLNSLTNEIHI